MEKAAAATSRTARRTRLKAEIMALNREINKAKQEFGVQAYEMVVADDFEGAKRVCFYFLLFLHQISLLIHEFRLLWRKK